MLQHATLNVDTKKFIKVIFIFLLSILIFCITYNAKANSVRYDVNQDGYINTVDAMLTLKSSLNIDMSGTSWQSTADTGDVNCDGSLTTVDSRLLLKKSLGFDMSGTGWCLSGQSPEANAGLDRSARINQTITLVGKGSDLDGYITSYEWKDGTEVVSNSVSFPYTPTTIGEHTLTLIVTDNNGLSDEDSITVTVSEAIEDSNQPPKADAGLVKYSKINEEIIITGKGSDVDGNIVSYQWKDGDTVISNVASVSYTPTTLGKHELVLTVTDNKGVSDSDTLVIFTIGGDASSATVNITEVGGGGDYECDGIDDEVQINQALASLSATNGGKVHIGTTTCVISNPIEIVSNNTILEGEGMDNSIIKLTDEANWGEVCGSGESAVYCKAEPLIINNGALHNIAVRNLKIDGNKYNQHYNHPTKGTILVDDGQGNYAGLSITSNDNAERASNILISSVYVYENNVDAFIVFNANNIIVENTKTLRIGHSATYFLDPVNMLVENNNFTLSANSGIRWYDGNHIILRNNFVQGDPSKDGNSNFAVEVTSGQTSRILDDLLIENNTFRFTAGAAIALDAKSPTQAMGAIIRNNIIYQCGNIGTWVSERETGAINLKNFTNTLIENNTIVNTIGSAIRLGGNVGFNNEWDEVKGTTALIRNNIITNSIDDDANPKEVPVYGIDIADGHSATCIYNNVWNNHTANYKGCEPGIGSMSVDPKFKSIVLGTNFNNTNDENADLHLKSELGRWDSSTLSWIIDSESSTSINAGMLSSEYSNENSPNGNRINLGAYGNTTEASKGNKGLPIADAGENQYLRVDEKGYVRVDLDGSNSFDDGSIVSYKWKKDDILLGEGKILSDLVMGIGIHKITLDVVDDDGNVSRDSMIVRVNPNVDNIAPNAKAGSDQTVTDSDDDGIEHVMLKATDSFDEDGIILEYTWSENGIEIANTSAPILDFTVGVHTVTLSVIDNEGKISTNDVRIEVKEKNDYALRFNDEVNDEFVIIDNVAMPSPDLTIEMWVKQTETTGDTDALINLGNQDGQRIVLKSNLGRLPSWGLEDYSNTGISMNQWHHLAFVIENNILTHIYIDGVPQTITGDGVIVMPDAYIGIASFYQGVASDLNFKGIIDEVRLWDVARSSSDISNNMNIELSGSEDNLVGYWNFNEGSGTKLIDKTSAGNDGDLYNMDANNWVLGAINPH